MSSRLLQFDETALRASLGNMKPSSACALGLAACCRSLGSFSDYRRKAGLPPRSEPFDTASQLWDLIVLPKAGDAMHPLIGVCDELLTLIPGEDDPWNDSAAFADDAVAALYYCVSTLVENDPANATYALRRSYEATDHLATEKLGLSVIRKQDEVEILSAHCIQLELHRQLRDRHLVQVNDLKTLRAMAQIETIFDEAPFPS